MAAKNSRLLVIAAFLLGLVCGVLSLAALRHSPSGVVQAQGAAAAGGCNNASLDGAYGLKLSGFRLAAPDGTALANPAPFNLIGAGTADGAGNFSGIETADNDGTIRQGSESGTYLVNANCTLTITGTAAVSNGNNVTLHLIGVLVDGGKKGYLIDSDTSRLNVEATIERQ